MKSEKFYWVWSAIIIVLILSSLFLDRETLVEIQLSGLNVVLFLSGMILVALAVLTHGWFDSRIGYTWFMILGILAIYCMLFFRYLVAAERSHLIEYSILALFLLEAFKKRKQNGFDKIKPGWFALMATSLIGLFDESLQLLIPNRVFDPYDMVFNCTAAALAVGSSGLVRWFRLKVQN